MRALALLVGIVLAAGLPLSIGCGGPHWSLEPPSAFKRYEDSGDLKYITADGVMLKVRDVENYPRADLEFWADALRRHLEARGYALAGETRFQTARGLPGFSADFLLPHGAEDWVLSETLFVVGERIVVIEAAGPYERFRPLAPALRQAYETFTARN